MALIGNTYIQAGDPGAVGFGYWWAHPTTGVVKSRNTSNTGWVSQGNWNTVNSGSLPLTGGVMTGAITGVSSWAPIASPDFTGTPQKGGIALATVNDLSTAITSLQSLIDLQVSSALSSTSAAISIGNNLAFGSGGGLDHGQTVPLPQYSNGDDATQDEVLAIFVSIHTQQEIFYGGIGSYNPELKCEVDPDTRIVTCTWTKPGDPPVAGKVNYLIICGR